MKEDLKAAIDSVKIGPEKNMSKLAAQLRVCKYCIGNENVDQAAARIILKELERTRDVIRETLIENAHLADGDVCTLFKLKKIIES